MQKLPALKIARKLEGIFRPHEICSLDRDYHVFVVAYNGTYVEHRHEADEFIYLLEGELSIEVEGETQQLRQGDAILIPAGKRHRPSASNRALAMVIEQKGLQPGGSSS